MRIEYFIIFLYSLISQYFLSITPLSFEDHFVWTQMITILIPLGIGFRFLYADPIREIKGILRYVLSFIFLHGFLQIGFSFIFQEVCKLNYGLMWYLFLELPTIIFLTGLSLFSLSKFKSKWAPLGSTIVALLLFGAFNIYDLLYTPTLYALHPTIGYYPGPLYDEWIPIAWNMIVFRIWTTAFGLSFYFSIRFKKAKYIVVLLFLPLFFRTSLHFQSTHKSIQSNLSVHQESKYAKIYAKQTKLSQIQLDSIDYYIEQIENDLKLQKPIKPIRIYIYEDSFLKKQLSGTHFTMIGNPMQRSLHLVTLSTWDSLVVHELTHALSGEMKDSFLSIPLKPLLLEGLATHTQKTIGIFSIHQWAKGIVQFRETTNLSMIDGIGAFYALPSLHAYALAGSWTGYLVQTFGIDAYKKYYGGESFRKSFQKDLEIVELEWLTFINQTPLTDIQYNQMLSALQRKSVFDAKCPHEYAHAMYKLHLCTKSSCKKKWEQFARTCNPERFRKEEQKSPLQNFTSSQSKEFKQQKVRRSWIEKAKNFERKNDLTQAIGALKKAMEIKQTLPLEHQLQRLLYLKASYERRNPVRIK